MPCKPGLLVACILALATGAWGRCLPPTDLTFPHPPTPPHTLRHACFGVVRYPFFVPPDKEPADLNAEAIALLNSTMLGIFPPSCQTKVLEMVCGAVYLQCDAAGNFDLFDEDVRDFLASQSEDLSLHFKRPCSSLCAAATDECWKLLPMLAPDIACDQERSWLPDAQLESINILLSDAGLNNQTGVAPLFDDRDNATYCNMVEGNMKTGGPTKETYVGEACRDFADEIYIPAGPALSLAPIQPPGAIQAALEQQISDRLKRLPLWVPYDCMYAMRKLFCTSVFMPPQLQSLGEALASNPDVPITEDLLNLFGYPGAAITAHQFYLPQYPHRDFCEDYNAHCAEFLARANNPLLYRDCDAEVDGIKSFPNDTQVLTTLSRTLPAGVPLTMTFSTDPNNATYGPIDYAPKCPEGYAVPEDPNDEDNSVIAGTACAGYCGAPIWSRSEWKFILSLTEICSGVALLLATIHLLWWTYDKAYKKRPLAYLMVINVLFFTVPYSMKIFMSFEDAFCRNNVNGLDESDGFTPCYYSGLSIWYFGQVIVLNWLCIATDIYVRVVLGHKRPNTFLKVYIPCIYLLPLPVTIYAVTHNHIGFDKTHTYCFVNDDGRGDIDLKLWFYPNAALCALGTILMCCVVYKIWTVTGSASKQNPPASSASSFSRKLKPLIVPIKFVVLFLIVWFALFAVRYQVDARYDRIWASARAWGQCVFANFDGTNHWKKVCGETPSERVAPATGSFIMAAACSIATITFLIFMVNAENFKRVSKALHPGRIYALTTGRSTWVSEPVSYPSSSQAISGESSASGSASPTAATSEALSPKNQAET